MSTSPTEYPATQYRGRFAPSPTGPLHAGSLVAALGSYLDARHHRGYWALRFDDIDPPRQVEGTAEHIMSALTAHGLEWDGPVIYQSSESARYEHALRQLSAAGWLFRCRCSRATLSPQGTCGQECENRDVTLDEPHSLRVRFDASRDHYFEDRFLGPQQIDPGSAPRDFIVKRRDGLYAYQLAAAVDDAQPQFTAVVRGADLLDSTYRQLWLQQLLDLESPQYAHVTVVNDELGNKLSKQTGAPALVPEHAALNLRSALSDLKQAAPPGSARGVAEILDFATEHWSFPSRH